MYNFQAHWGGAGEDKEKLVNIMKGGKRKRNEKAHQK